MTTQRPDNKKHRRITTAAIILILLSGLIFTGCPNPMDEAGGDETPDTASVTGISLDRSAATIAVGDTLQLSVTVEPEDAETVEVTWSSDDEGVASVSGDGLVTGIATGTAVISVSSSEGGFTAECEITVAEEVPPQLAYGFHFMGNNKVALSFDRAMDAAALDVNSNYSVNINGGTAAAPAEVLPKTASASTSEYTGVILDFSNHADAPLALGDELTVTLSANIVSSEGVPLEAGDRTVTFPFEVDINAAGFDGTMITYDSPAARNVSIGVIGADPSSLSIFDAGFTPVSTGDDRDYLQVYAYKRGFEEGHFAGSTNGAPNDTPDFTETWNKALGAVKTTDTYEPIIIDRYCEYTLSYVDTNQGGESLVAYSSDPVAVNNLEIAGTWLLSNINLGDGHTAGTDGFEWTINDSVYTLIYTGPSVYGNYSYGTVESYNTEDNYFIVKQTDDNLDPSANGRYFKQEYTFTPGGNLVFSTYEGKSTAAEAESSTTVIWGPTAELTEVPDTVPEITGVWAGPDDYGPMEYAITPTKIGFERLDNDGNSEGTGGGDIVSADNNSNTIIFYMVRHSALPSQENTYGKITYTPADPVNVKDSEITLTLYGPHSAQEDAEGDIIPDIAAHTVVRQ